jgi:hypothetical protein
MDRRDAQSPMKAMVQRITVAMGLVILASMGNLPGVIEEKIVLDELADVLTQVFATPIFYAFAHFALQAIADTNRGWFHVL